MQAIILAAGRGRRLGDCRPKCLQEVGGAALVEHQLVALADAGVADVIIVVGFEAGAVREIVGAAARFVLNERFAETNSLSSFLLARPLIDDDVLILNGDVFVAPEVVAAIVAADGDALLYDSSSGDEDEHMKVHVAGGLLVEMAKDLSAGCTCGENVGILRLSASTADLTFEAAAQLVAVEGGEHLFLAAAVNCVAAYHPMYCLDVAGLPWIEIDFREDLDRARSEVYPALAGSTWRNEELVRVREAELIAEASANATALDSSAR